LRGDGESVTSRPDRWPSALPEKDYRSFDSLIRAAFSFARPLREYKEAALGADEGGKPHAATRKPGHGETIRRRWPAEIMDNCRVDLPFYLPGMGPIQSKAGVSVEGQMEPKRMVEDRRDGYGDPKSSPRIDRGRYIVAGGKKGDQTMPDEQPTELVAKIVAA
jgi:hypothetical protein